MAQSQSRGTLDYHALQARLVRRFSGGVSLQMSYTFGKAIDLSSDTDGNARFPNSYDLAYNRGPANYDVTHVLTSTWVYALPFARGSALGGWQVSGVLLARSGYPFTVFQSQGPRSTFTAAAGGGQLYRPDRIASGSVDDPTVDRWFDTERVRADDRADGDVRQRRAQYSARARSVHDRCRAREADERRRSRDRVSTGGLQSAESSGVCEPRQHDRLRQRRDDLQPDALHADAAAADRIEGKILTGRAHRVQAPEVADMRSPQPAPSSDVPPSLVRAELDRILASEIFSRSDRLSAFLRFIVEQTLSGQGDSLKEQVIAEELYGKGADFSTAADPIVRVDARRLRDKLREYYASAPRGPGRHFRAQGQLHAGIRDQPRPP